MSITPAHYFEAVGRRKTAGVCLRMYDKTLHVQKFGLDYWYPIWGERFDPTLPVWRIEFEFGRKALLAFGINATTDAFPMLGGLWANATTSLYRVATPTGDETRSRWPTSPEWSAIQDATLRADAVPIERLLDHKKAGTLRTLAPLLNGVLSTYGALKRCTTIEEVLNELPEDINEYEVWTSVSFADRIEAKRRR